jgi:XTP/dITP diphosphohydrolase
MDKKIIFATGNKNKMIEIRQILGDLGWEILSMKEAGISIDIEENGTTFEENALIKAQAVAKYCDGIVLADDSGLEIDYLNKEPGIYSARYAGEDTPYEIKNQMLLDRLAGVPKEQRSARFVCAIAAAVPGQAPMVVRGTIEGYIGEKPAGENGFGYDPIFYVPDLDCSTAELSPEEKNARSHRGNALRAMREKLKEMMDNESLDCE